MSKITNNGLLYSCTVYMYGNNGIKGLTAFKIYTHRETVN